MIVQRCSFLSLFVVLAATVLAGSGQAALVVVVDDSFADNDRAKTGTDDTNWYATNTTSAFESPSLTNNQLRMATGTSGRGIHTVFTAQSLSNIGDKITATYTFTTPSTIGASTGSFRVGMFNPTATLAGVSQDLSVGSSSPNVDLNMPGYMVDMDVSPSSAPNATSDFQFRKLDSASATGRLLGTTSGFVQVDSSGPDAGYSFAPNTTYTGLLSFELVATGTQMTAILGSDTYTVIDDGTYSGAPVTDFGFFGVHVNSNVFGNINDASVPDSGIAFNNVRVEFSTTAVPEPSSLALLMLGCLGGVVRFVRRRK
ncbi:PEP-CTERM motif protein [Rubripirellula tenax]|uniref:PEP-CTERM motif protein n=1 Tax=Rubripirellula tenax TaxID=2528015 RepID=A0A5C6EJW8_9BACT|nr:PEP-CTERM sorting domain-containing protein [Rubripirellula tenax]TWU48705.1 PEP-CTERM motif protein [Rubripirellula tenax]